MVAVQSVPVVTHVAKDGVCHLYAREKCGPRLRGVQLRGQQPTIPVTVIPEDGRAAVELSMPAL